MKSAALKIRLGSFFFLLSVCSIMAQEVVFPLKISDTKRYFTDQRGRPFLYHADTGWWLPCALTLDEAREYMTIRKEQGFNTLQFQLAMTVGMKNRNGDYIFDGDNDFSRPNEAYHNHVLALVDMAESFGMLVVLTQPWVGCCGEGFGRDADKPIRQNGIRKNRDYGRYLGKKFGRCTNLFWLIGGDNDPNDDLPELEAFATGLRETAPTYQLLTYHASQSHSSTDIFYCAPWLGFSMVYTYWKDKPSDWIVRDQEPEVYEACLREYNKSCVRPFVLGEAQYEGTIGNDIGIPLHVRRQAYWSLLSGACGHAYGSENWYFPPHWKKLMYNEGATQLIHFYRFFTSLEWWKLVPDQRHTFVVSGYGDFGRLNYITAAVTSDKRSAALYVHQQQTFKVDLSVLETENAEVRWYNPRTGEYVPVGILSGICELLPPTHDDWVLSCTACR